MGLVNLVLFSNLAAIDDEDEDEVTTTRMYRLCATSGLRAAG